jgi:hypothetical protein
MVYISPGNRRMKIPTFSLPSETTCPNSTELCRDNCYAKKAERAYKNVLPSRIRNLKETKDKIEFAVNIYKWLIKKQPKYFRIHESGDFYSQDYFDIWCGVSRLFPEINFLAYTQMYDLDLTLKPDNLILYWTVWPDSKDVPINGLKAYVIDNGKNKIPYYKTPETNICTKTKSGITCDQCLYCFEGRGNVKFKIH